MSQLPYPNKNIFTVFKHSLLISCLSIAGNSYAADERDRDLSSPSYSDVKATVSLATEETNDLITRANNIQDGPSEHELEGQSNLESFSEKLGDLQQLSYAGILTDKIIPFLDTESLSDLALTNTETHEMVKKERVRRAYSDSWAFHVDKHDPKYLIDFLDYSTEIQQPVSLRLEGLRIEYKDRVKDILSHCHSVHNLKIIGGYENFIEDLLEILPQQNSLLILQLINNIDDCGVEAIANSTTLNKLTHLNLIRNKISTAGVEAIANSTTLNNLTHLNLSSNRIGDDGAIAIANSRTLTNLTHLELHWNRIGDAGVVAIANSTRLNNLTHLNFGINQISTAGAAAIANSTRLNNLTHLHLGCNRIGDAGATAIANSQTLNKLIYLNLESNEIDKVGAFAIANSRTLTNLTHLELPWNQIGDAGAEAIANSTTLNNLTHLNLVNNQIGVAGAEAIAKSKTLRKIKSFIL